MYERHRQPLLPLKQFVWRFLRHALLAIALIAFALGIGMAGYYHFERLSLLDSFLNASMILGGMGPVNELHTRRPSCLLVSTRFSQDLFSSVLRASLCRQSHIAYFIFCT